MRNFNSDDPVDKAIIDAETVFAKLTGKSAPFALITDDMTEDEREMAIFEMLLKQGFPEDEATKEAKKQLEKLNAIDHLL